MIKVDREKEFEELKASMERAFGPDRILAFLKVVQAQGIRIRDFDGVLKHRVLEQVDGILAKLGMEAAQLYEALTTSDQAQIRESYLTKIEEVDSKLRGRFHKLYQYY